MTLDELKALLEGGKITQEQFNAMAKAIDPNYTPEEPKGDEEEEKDDNAQPDIEKLVQQAVDRATNKLGNEKKKLQQELDRIKREKMTDEERRQADLSDKERELAEREAELLDKENRLYAVKAIKVAGLDDGSDKALELVEFVMDSDTSKIDAKIKAFGDLVKKFVKAEVDKTFKDNGRNPNKGGNGGSTKNPYAKDSFNLTEQMRLETENPELAKQLRAAAGV